MGNEPGIPPPNHFRAAISIRGSADISVNTAIESASSMRTDRPFGSDDSDIRY